MQKLIPKATLHNLVLTFRRSKKDVLNKHLNTIPEFAKGRERFSETRLKHFVQLLVSNSVITETLPGSNETSTTPFLVNETEPMTLKMGNLIFGSIFKILLYQDGSYLISSHLLL